MRVYITALLLGVQPALAEPGKVASYDGFERWEYPDLRGGRVNFDDAGALMGWRLPPGPRQPAAASGR